MNVKCKCGRRLQYRPNSIVECPDCETRVRMPSPDSLDGEARVQWERKKESSQRESSAASVSEARPNREPDLNGTPTGIDGVQRHPSSQPVEKAWGSVSGSNAG